MTIADLFKKNPIDIAIKALEALERIATTLEKLEEKQQTPSDKMGYSGQEICLDRSPTGKATCCLARNHTGPHTGLNGDVRWEIKV